MALDMAQNGQKVVVNYIQGCEADALATVEECKKLGGDAFAIEADCSNNEQVQNLFKKAVEHFGTIDVLINNAGVTRDNLVARMKPEEWNLVLSINLTGVFFCMQEFFKVAAENGRGGRVINMASVVGQVRIHNATQYCFLLIGSYVLFTHGQHSLEMPDKQTMRRLREESLDCRRVVQRKWHHTT